MEKVKVKRHPDARKSSYCGVPQCNTYRTDGYTMHRLPLGVQKCKILLKKWSDALRMEKPFPKFFCICSRHFTKEEILTPIRREGVLQRTMLTKGAFPTLNLPKLSLTKKKTAGHKETSDADVLPLEAPTVEEKQITPKTRGRKAKVKKEFHDKEVQTDMYPLIYFTSIWNTNKKLKTMTGLPNISSLNMLVTECENLRTGERVSMSMKDRVLLTMYKLKCSPTFAELAISFEISNDNAKLYFADTIQLLAKVTEKWIYWETEEQNMRSLPFCFGSFPNVRTVIDCIEMKTLPTRCFTCKTPSCSHYQSSHILKVLVGESPSGMINYVSKVIITKHSDKALFNLIDLLDRLEPGDDVIVGKGFLIGDELSDAGIEIIKPDDHIQTYSKDEIERNTNIAAARVHIEKQVAMLKMFRILTKRIGVFVLAYMDDIMTVLCGLSNLSSTQLGGRKLPNKSKTRLTK